MLIYKDERQLDSDFPFCIERICLKKEDNADEHFHYHDFYEITYIEKGHGFYSVAGRQLEMKEGDLIVFNRMEPHGWTVLDDNMQVLVLMFSTQLFTEMLVSREEYISPVMEHGGNFMNRLAASDAHAPAIRTIMEDSYHEYDHREEGYDNIIRSDVMKILIYLMRHYQKEDIWSDESLGEKKQVMNRLEQAFIYINAHYTEAISLEEVAALVYMSPHYFSSYFKRVAGCTFIEYVTLMRLKKARSMYISTDMGVAAIALECGFRNMSNFYRLYKKYLGDLPKRR